MLICGHTLSVSMTLAQLLRANVIGTLDAVVRAPE